MRRNVPEWLLWASLTAGCGSAGTYRSGHYTDHEADYFVEAPGENWRSIAVSGGGDLAWLDPQSSCIVQINASCDPAMDIPLPALTNHLLIGFTERSFRAQDLITMSSREALRTHVGAKLDGVERELVLVVLKKDGCVYDFSLTAPSASALEHVRDSFERSLASFRAGESGS